MLTVKAKHATMLLTVSDAEGLSERSHEVTTAAQAKPSTAVVSNIDFVLLCFFMWKIFVLFSCSALSLTILQKTFLTFSFFWNCSKSVIYPKSLDIHHVNLSQSLETICALICPQNL